MKGCSKKLLGTRASLLDTWPSLRCPELKARATAVRKQLEEQSRHRRFNELLRFSLVENHEIAKMSQKCTGFKKAPHPLARVGSFLEESLRRKVRFRSSVRF